MSKLIETIEEFLDEYEPEDGEEIAKTYEEIKLYLLILEKKCEAGELPTLKDPVSKMLVFLRGDYSKESFKGFIDGLKCFFAESGVTDEMLDCIWQMR